MNLSEEIYILYRRFKAAIGWSIYALCALRPIQKNKIVFSCFEGGGYGCNPKYIAEEIIHRMRTENKEYELFWLVNDVTKEFPLEIHKVKNNLWNRAFHLSTAGVWIDNARKNYGTRKRKGQLYIQTWHGQIGFKPVGKLRGSSFSKIAALVTKADAKLVDFFLINSKWAQDVYSRAFYGENLLKVGSPRCDILFNRRAKQYHAIREKYQLPCDAKILLYAPTFRGGSQKVIRNVFEEEITLDIPEVCKALSKKFPGKWYIFLRLHPQLALRMKSLSLHADERLKNCIDISQEDDLYEYLAGMDGFISDYTSAEIEAAYMYIPVFVYADDLSVYTSDRGKLLCDIHEFPFSVAETNQELIANIASFDEEHYLREVDEFFSRVQLLEDGKASSRVVDMIEGWKQ